MLRRRIVVALGAAVLVAGVLGGAGPVRGHGSSPECTGEILPDDVRTQTWQPCIFHFVGLPILVEGYFYTDHPQIESDFHVEVTAVLDNGRSQVLPVECTDNGRPNDPRAQCRYEWNPLANGRQSSEAPMLHEVAYLLCEAHTHARESRLYQRSFGPAAGGEFRCASAPYDASPGSGPGGAVGDPPPAPYAGAPAFVAVPVNVYATGTTAVSSAAASVKPPAFLNLDQALHDVVALDARRPDGSAHWCHGYEPGTCPLFWSQLIGQGEVTPVEGFGDTPQGSYRFYCSIHPDMIGEVVVQ